MAKTTAIRTGEASPPLLFRHVSPGPGDSTLQFRLLHFWEARKNVKGGPGILLGIEMLMIDAEVVKAETLTISEISAFLKHQPAKENGGDASELEVPLPQCFIDTIGQTKKFKIKVAHYNFTSTRLSLNATKIVSPAVLPPKNPPQKHRPGAEVEISDVAESSGGGTSATDDQKKAKRTKRSG
ncbi:hypothetical protein YC2023_041708 [Brassica napus]